MTQPNNPDAKQRLKDHRLRLQAAGAVPMTAEEILAGRTQGGVPRPSFIFDDDADDAEQEAPHGTH